MSLQQSKTILAKLLAAENIKVEFRKVETASFDVKNRIMTLPLWEDMSAELYDLLGGHEVGHALHTPADGWHDAITQNVGKNFKTFLNVVEDARIERKIKDKFPGIRKSFSKGYNDLLCRNFFGIKGVDVNELILIDRINLHYKIGALSGVAFSEEESTFIRQIDKADSWEEVVEISKRLFAYCKQELDDMREEKKERLKSMSELGYPEDDEDDEDSDSDSEDDSEDDDYGNGSSSYDNEDDESEEDEDGESDSESGDEGQQRRVPGQGGQGYSHLYDQEEEPMSITDKNFQDKVKTLSQSKDVVNGFLPAFSKMDTKKVVVDWKKLYGKIANNTSESYQKDLFSKFESKNKNAVSYLVKEFELRKRAAELRRVSISDTGMIDTNLLHSYKFSDDIFRKIASVAEGKNHGLIAMVDWSGSMQSNLNGTVEQLLVLTLFCRKLNIPFEVYAFSDQYPTDYKNRVEWTDNSSTNQIDLRMIFSLLNILSSRMSNQAFRNTANDLLNVSNAYSGRSGYFSRYLYAEIVNPEMSLGGTPLNAAIVALSKVVNEFRTANRLEIVNTVILTDGEDSDCLELMNTDKSSYRCPTVGPENKYNVSYIFDDETKKNYRVGFSGVTPTLLQILKARTGCNLVGFYVVTNNKKYFNSAIGRLKPTSLYGEREEALRKFKQEGVYAIDSMGYDEYYMIPGGNALETSDDNLDDFLGNANDKITTRKLSGAFLKLNQNRLNSRVLLKKFIEKTT